MSDTWFAIVYRRVISHTGVPSRGDSMRVLGDVVRRSRQTRLEPETASDSSAEQNVTILEGKTVQPLSFDAAVPARKRRARSPSMSAAAIAARRARAESKALEEAPLLSLVHVSTTELVTAPETKASVVPVATRPHAPRRPRLTRPPTGVRTAAVVVMILAGVVFASVHRSSSYDDHQPAASAAAVAGLAPPPAPSPTTAPPAPPSTVAVTADGAHASVATTPTAQVTLTSSGPCWIRATHPDTGAVMLESTLQPDTPQGLELTGAAHLRVGAANTLTLTVDGRAVPLPNLPAGPYDIDFTGTATS
jgi:hypothetical protein